MFILKNKIEVAPRICPVCGDEFTPRNNLRVYCGERCSKRAMHRRSYYKRLGRPVPLEFKKRATARSEGSITLLRGRYRVRACRRDKKRTLGVYDTSVEAENALLEYLRTGVIPDRTRIKKVKSRPVRYCRECGKRIVRKGSHKYCTLKCGRKFNDRIKEYRKRGATVGVGDLPWNKRVRCYYCGEKLTLQTRTRDHIVPLAYGGKNVAYNMVWACRSCNSTKGTKNVNDFIQSGQLQINYRSG